MTFAGLAVATIGGVVVVSMLTHPTPLTAMAPAQLRYVHHLDGRQFRDLDRTLRGMVARLESQADLFSSDAQRVPTPDEEKLVLDTWVGFTDAAIALDQVRRFYEDYYRFDLSRRQRDLHVRGFVLTFAAELSLFENSARVIDVLERNENVVRFLNVPRPELSLPPDSVALVREELSGLQDLGRVAGGRRYLVFLDQVHLARAEAVGEGYEWLWGDIERYLMALDRRQRREVVTLSVASDAAPMLRSVKHLSFPVQKGVAQWMGDVRFKRAGRPLIARTQMEKAEENLMPGDILLSRKNWYLSNVGLPGFWPHAILYVGSNDQLEATFDEEPRVRQWVQERSGADLSYTEFLARTYPIAWRERSLSQSGPRPVSVIEAISEGVVQNSLHDAYDHLAGLRPRQDSLTKARAIERAFSYLDRPYDFDFDFATDDALVCTELVRRSYRPRGGRPGLELSPISVAGRLTLPANEIARTFKRQYGSPDRQLDFVLYLEGREEDGHAVSAGVESFLATPERSKWYSGL